MNVNKNLLCLKWDNYNSFVVEGISSLFQKDDMVDTTLFAEGRSFRAHKIVLALWSSYFREIYSVTSQHTSHPIVVLRETTSADIELILRFIYHGQVFVALEDIERFLKTAQYFQIAGLKDMRVHNPSQQHPRTDVDSTSTFGMSDGTTPDGVHLQMLGNSIVSSSPEFVAPSTPTTTSTFHASDSSSVLVATIPAQVTQFDVSSSYSLHNPYSNNDANAPGLVLPVLHQYRGSNSSHNLRQSNLSHHHSQQKSATVHNNAVGNVRKDCRESIGKGPSIPSVIEEDVMDGSQEEVLGLAYLTAHGGVSNEAVGAPGDRSDAIQSDEIMDAVDPSIRSATKMQPNTKRNPPVANNITLIRNPAVGTMTSGSKPSGSVIKPDTRTNRKKQRRRIHPSSTSSSGTAEFVSCPKCSKKVKKSSLRVHIQRTHLEEGTVLTCPVCGKHLSSKGVYYKHMYWHRQRQEANESHDNRLHEIPEVADMSSSPSS